MGIILMLTHEETELWGDKVSDLPKDKHLEYARTGMWVELI